MAHQVRTNYPLTQLPKGPGSETQRIEGVDVVVTLTDEEFNRLPSDIFTDGALDDLGVLSYDGDQVSVQAGTVAAPAALTSTQNATAVGSDAATTQALANSLKTSYNALQADVAALRTTVANLITALRGSGKPMA